jgi:hypothetical protein
MTDRVVDLTRARPKSPTLATPRRLIRILVDLHFGKQDLQHMCDAISHHLTHVAVYDARFPLMQVLQALSDVDHEFELIC